MAHGLFLIEHKNIIAPSKIIAAVFNELGRNLCESDHALLTLEADSEEVKSLAVKLMSHNCFPLHILNFAYFLFLSPILA